MNSIYLDENKDIPILLDGFKRGYSPGEREKAETVLKRIGYQRITRGPAWKQKPGRKTPTNPTEDEIYIRIEFLRLVLGDAAKKLTVSHLLSAVARLLGQFRDQCSRGIYFTSIERGRIYSININVGSLTDQMSDHLRPSKMPRSAERYIPSEEELRDLLDGLAESADDPTHTTWADMVTEAIDASSSKSEENRSYTELQVQLGLAIEGPSVSETEAVIASLKKKRPRKPSAKAEANSKIQSLESDKWMRELYQERSKNDTLRTVISKLFCIRNVLDTCRYVPVDWGTENLYNFVHRAAHYMDPRDITPLHGELESLFLEATKRQGISPFPPVFDEEMDFGPPWIPEDGQLKAMPPRKENVDPVESVVRVVKMAGTDGILKADISKTLVQKSICSQATAYNWISAAVKQRKIRKLETKRFVVADDKPAQ